MKNIKFVLAAMVVSLFASCDSAIDIDQPGELGPDATFQTVDDLQKGLWGVYGAMTSRTEVSFSSIWTDEVRLGFANGGQGLNDGTYGFVLNTNSNDAYAIWQSNYSLINFANRVIEGAANVKVAGANVAAKNDIIAQAKIIRAYAHFKLICYFSTNPADPNALGAILMNHVPKTNEHLPRSTNAAIYAFIDEDLAYGNQYLKTNADNKLVFNGNPAHVLLSKDFIKALQARIYLFKGDWANAKATAEALYSTYPLSPESDYEDIWKDGTAVVNEVIFQLYRVNGDSKMGSIWASVNSTVTGSPFYAVSTDLYNMLKDPNDVRLRTVISSTSDFSDPGKICIAKYTGKPNLLLLNDEKIFRSSEMLLIMAEADAELGQLNANFYIDELNNARYALGFAPLSNAPASKQEALKMILDARRVELCYEGHRYLDLKRMGKKAGLTGITRSPIDCQVNGACFLPIDSHMFTMPIPNDEMMPNTAIRGQQNPGY